MFTIWPEKYDLKVEKFFTSSFITVEWWCSAVGDYLQPDSPIFVQLVHKVKLDFVLEQLASASVGGYGQDVWSELVDEAKTNLMKITVSVTILSPLRIFIILIP